MIRKLTANEGRPAELEYLMEYVSAQACGRALALVAATKINWYNTSHNTGQGSLAH
jgi:hypothetical protein